MLVEAAKSTAGSAAGRAVARTLTVATWNVAAVNNNPFEYWLTIPSQPSYERLMIDVENFLESPGDGDVPVSDVFTQDMYDKLERRMSGLSASDSGGWAEHIPAVRTMWENDYRGRKIVSEFIRDKSLGSKRLASMPDRVTNTVNVVDTVDGSPGTACRPAVINMYDGDLSTVSQWYDAWETFMFETSLEIPTGKKTGGGDTDKAATKSIVPYQMLRPIKRSKYPDVTEEEEKVSLPLQTVCGAIFDAILVHMMNTVSSPDAWQPLKRTIADSLVRQKVPNTLGILEKQYAEACDVITLQEASLALVEVARAGKLGDLFHILAPAGADPSRDQNSVVLLKKGIFEEDSIEEITNKVEEHLGEDAPVARGDILAVRATDVNGVAHVVASFHGDTNGLATAPVLEALMTAVSSSDDLKTARLIFGLDANTYEKAKPGKQADVLEFGTQYVARGLTSCWGDVPQPTNYTTFNARTYLQPQLNKACKSSDKRSGGDVNPKDFILFRGTEFGVRKVWKDNTGQGTYTEGMAFPTLSFPSDHGILAGVLDAKEGDDAETCSS